MRIIFDDQVRSGWNGSGHGASFSATPAQSGTRAISVRPSWFQTIVLRSTGNVSVAGAGGLRFWVSGATAGGQNVNIVVSVGFFDYPVSLTSLLGHPPRAGVWEQVRVPLSRFGLSTGTIDSITFSGASLVAGSLVLVDDVALDSSIR